ncbi:MAG: Arc family DNA-binding protein [Eubacteriales bacterium]|nr:Arc family DNA-binding protein [Eubacteriales bacterium]
MGAINFRMPDDLHRKLTNLANDNGRSLNSQILYSIYQTLGDIGSAPTLVHSEELGDMLFMPSGKIADVSDRVFVRFCDGKFPIGAANWDDSFNSLAEAAEASGAVAARYLQSGLVVEDHALWYELYRKYAVMK